MIVFGSGGWQLLEVMFILMSLKLYSLQTNWVGLLSSAGGSGGEGSHRLQCAQLCLCMLLLRLRIPHHPPNIIHQPGDLPTIEDSTREISGLMKFLAVLLDLEPLNRYAELERVLGVWSIAGSIPAELYMEDISLLHHHSDQALAGGELDITLSPQAWGSSAEYPERVEGKLREVQIVARLPCE